MEDEEAGFVEEGGGDLADEGGDLDEEEEQTGAPQRWVEINKLKRSRRQKNRLEFTEHLYVNLLARMYSDVQAYMFIDLLTTHNLH